MRVFGMLIAVYATQLKGAEDDSLNNPKKIGFISQSEKGKPLERVGRKVTGLRFEFTKYGRRAAGRIKHLRGATFGGWPCNFNSTMGRLSRTEWEEVLSC